MQKNLDRLGGLHQFAARAAGADPGRRQPRGRLFHGPAQRDAHLGSTARTSSHLLKADTDVAAKLPAAELRSMFDEAYHFKHVDTIFRRVFGQMKLTDWTSAASELRA